MVDAPLQTAALITFTLYMLSEHPHVHDRLRQEVIATVGNANRPTPEDLRNMKYLRAVLNGRRRFSWWDSKPSLILARV